jgi:surface protein
MTDLPKYHSFPPLTPHEPTKDSHVESLHRNGIITELDFSGYDTSQVTDMSSLGQVGFAGCNEITLPIDFDSSHIECGNEMAKAWFAARDKPTPTIPQMTDRHEREVFTDKAERVVNKVLAFALTVLAVVFVGGLMYKTFVWGY